MVQLSAGESPLCALTTPLPVPEPSPMIFMRNGPNRNFATMFRPVVIGTVQVRAPPQYPENPVKELVGSGVGMSVTLVPWAKLALHPVAAATPAVITQLMPAGLEVTVPLP